MGFRREKSVWVLTWGEVSVHREPLDPRSI